MAIGVAVNNAPQTQPVQATAKAKVELERGGALQDLDASKLVVNLASSLKPLPDFDNLAFGEVKTDHMLIVNFSIPQYGGWSTPEIKPYAPLELDPASSCLQYATSVFEGMKAYIGQDGEVRLFRPDRNMKRLLRSAERLALPAFDTEELLKMLKKLVAVDKRWIPARPGYSLYIRPTIIGTRSTFGVTASDTATLFVILSPSGPYFKTGPKPISLLALKENVRAWPGGTGGYKLGSNYCPGFLPTKQAAGKGYDQILWLLKDENNPEKMKITEAGAMNLFIVVRNNNGGVDIFTPPLDGTILPGVTRQSSLDLLRAHVKEATTIPGLERHSSVQIDTIEERVLTMCDLVRWYDEGRLVESFAVGTAVVVAGVGKVGYEERDILFPEYEGGLGVVGKAIRDVLADIQVGRVQYEDWSVVCE